MQRSTVLESEPVSQPPKRPPRSKSAEPVLGVFASLFGARDAAQFTASAWPARCLVHHGPRSRLPAVMQEGAVSSFAELASVYQGPLQMAGGPRGADAVQIGVEAVPAYILRRMGLTVVFNDVAPHGLMPWLSAVGDALGLGAEYLRMSAFASPPGGGLSIHYDSTANVIIQLEGKKRVHAAPSGVVAPTRQYTSGALPELTHQLERGGTPPPVAPARLPLYELDAGSVLFLPAGSWHTTEAREDSYSLSLIIEPPRYLDLILQGFANTLLQRAEWREPVRGYPSPSERPRQAAHVQKLLAQLAADLAELAPEELLTPWADRNAQASFVGPRSTLVRSEGVTLEVTRNRKHLRIYKAGGMGELPLGAASPEVIRWLARSKGAFSVSQVLEAVEGATLEQVVEAVMMLSGLEAIRLIPRRLG